MKAINLIQHDFDNMENIHAERSKSLGVFVAEGDLTAHGVVSKFIDSMPKFKVYTGHDGSIYPKFEAEKIELNKAFNG